MPRAALADLDEALNSRSKKTIVAQDAFCNVVPSGDASKFKRLEVAADSRRDLQDALFRREKVDTQTPWRKKQVWRPSPRASVRGSVPASVIGEKEALTVTFISDDVYTDHDWCCTALVKITPGTPADLDIALTAIWDSQFTEDVETVQIQEGDCSTICEVLQELEQLGEDEACYASALGKQPDAAARLRSIISCSDSISFFRCRQYQSKGNSRRCAEGLEAFVADHRLTMLKRQCQEL